MRAWGAFSDESGLPSNPGRSCPFLQPEPVIGAAPAANQRIDLSRSAMVSLLQIICSQPCRLANVAQGLVSLNQALDQLQTDLMDIGARVIDDFERQGCHFSPHDVNDGLGHAASGEAPRRGCGVIAKHGLAGRLAAVFFWMSILTNSYVLA